MRATRSAKASAICTQVQRTLAPAQLAKSDKSPVTVADFAAQAVVARALAESFPDDPLVAEEGSAQLREPENRALLERVADLCQATPDETLALIDRGAASPARRFWTLDPIDGTKGFLRGEQYAVALALIEDGEVVLGVLGCPNLPLEGADRAASPDRARCSGRCADKRRSRQSLAGGPATPIHVSDRHSPPTGARASRWRPGTRGTTWPRSSRRRWAWAARCAWTAR